MASGKQHVGVTLTALIPIGMSYYLISGNAPSAAIYGCLTGVLLSPDLDMPTKTISESIAGKIPVFGCLFYWYWLPYAKLIPHRHWLSHAPIVGTAVRLLYLLPVIMALDTVVVYSTDDLLAFAFGLACSDILHWIMDYKWR